MKENSIKLGTCYTDGNGMYYLVHSISETGKLTFIGLSVPVDENHLEDAWLAKMNVSEQYASFEGFHEISKEEWKKAVEKVAKILSEL